LHGTIIVGTLITSEQSDTNSQEATVNNGYYTLEVLTLPATVVAKYTGLSAAECSEMVSKLNLQPGERTQRTFENF
jgi:hypothetical protein